MVMDTILIRRALPTDKEFRTTDLFSASRAIHANSNCKEIWKWA